MKNYLKKLSLTFFTFNLIPSHAGAAEHIGRSHWWNQDGFSESSTLGAQFQSVDSALANCHQSGAEYCQFLITEAESIYSENGNRHLKFKSVVRSLSQEQLSSFTKTKTLKNTRSISNSAPLGILAAEAAKQLAFSTTMMDCYLESCAVCLPQETHLTETNNFREGAYYSTAETLVACYKPTDSALNAAQ